MNCSVAGDTGDNGDDSGDASFDNIDGFSPAQLEQLEGASSRLFGGLGTLSEGEEAADRFGSIVFAYRGHAH
jgi:hypothetical protein